MTVEKLTKIALITFFVGAGAPAHAQSANTASTAIATRPPQGHFNVVPTARVGSFKLVRPGGRPVFVTFNQCHNAAKESCGHGIESLDHEEKSGNCAFSCLSAPSNSD